MEQANREKTTQTESRNREQMTQTERINRPFQYQIYDVFDDTFQMEITVENCGTIPFNFWKRGKLVIVIERQSNRSKLISWTTSLKSSRCCINNSCVLESWGELNLVLTLQYRDARWQIQEESITEEIGSKYRCFQVTFEMERITENATFEIKIIETNSDVKYNRDPGLCNAESQFVLRRKQIVHNKLKNLLENLREEDVPHIAIIGSGGGMRAVIGMGAALDQLNKEGILDYAMYTAGLSGSAWYLMTLYAYDEKQLDLDSVNGHIQKELQKKFRIYLWMAFKVVTHYVKTVTYDHGEYFSFTNLFGEMIGYLLLGQKCTQKWSDQATKLQQGEHPLPLVSVLHVQDEKTINSYNDWMEFSPFQVFLPRYGAAIGMKLFGDTFHRGYCTRKYEEPPIHFLQGMCGSAYAIVRDFRPKGHEWYMQGIIGNNQNITNTRLWSLFNKFDQAFVAKVPNFIHGISQMERLSADSGWIHMTNSIKGDGQSTELIKRSLTSLSLKGVWYKRLRKFKNTTWSLIKESSRVLLDSAVVYFGYVPLFRAGAEKYDKRMLLVDAGVAFNSPYPPVLNPARAVDIIISFDFSDRGEDAALPFQELKKAEIWAREKGVPFPELYPQLSILEEQWTNGDQKEVYIFPGFNSPTIVHFVMVNKSFRFLKDGIIENIDRLLDGVDEIAFLQDLKINSVITSEEESHIKKDVMMNEKSKLFLELMIKKREPVLKQIQSTLKKKYTKKVIDQLLDDGHLSRILWELERESVISEKERKSVISEIGRNRIKYIIKDEDKKALFDILMKLKTPNSKQFLMILQKFQCEYIALQLIVVHYCHDKDTDHMSKYIDDTLGTLNMVTLLQDLERTSVISLVDKTFVQEQHDQKNELLKIMLKGKWPELNHLVKTLQKNDAPNNFDILPDYGTMRFSYSEKEFKKFNCLVRHNIKENRNEIIKCIREKHFEKITPRTEDQEISPTCLKLHHVKMEIYKMNTLPFF